MKTPTQTLAVALGLGLSFSSSVQAALNPIPITTGSYNADIVVEKTATPVLKVVTTASIDTGTNNTASTLMEVGFDTANSANGLPAPGSTFFALDAATNSYTLPPSYTAPNGILIDTVVSNGVFTLSSPAAYAKLSFLGLGGNGGDVIGVTINHLDGTSEQGSFGCPDWFGGAGVALIMGGRIGTTYNLDTQVNGNSGDGRANPRVYFRDITLSNTTSPVTNLVLRYVSGSSGSHNAILAVSGAAALNAPMVPVAVTGFNYDFVVEAGATKRGRVVSSTVIESTNVWATTQSMDSDLANTGNSWYERGYNFNVLGSGPVSPNAPLVLATAAASGLPAAGVTVTNAGGDRVYTFPPSYTANNALHLSPQVTNGTITLVTPTTVSVLSFLGAAAGGDQKAMVVVSHQNGSKETNAIAVPDWFNQAPAYFLGANGRVDVTSAQFNNATNTAFTPRLFGCDVIVSATSPVTSAELTYTNTGGRIALLAVSGTLDPILPVFVANPASVKANVGDPISFTASAIANVSITYQWQRGTNGVYVNVNNGGTVSGAQTTTLNISSAAESDDATYRLVATDGAGSANSATATATVITPLAVVTLPSDTISAYQPLGGSSPGGENVSHAIDQNTTKYLNFGTGGNINNGSIPLGFIVTPSIGRTKLNAMILYCANDATERDPANVILEGSDNGGATWSLVYSNSVTMPDGRNDAGNPVNPLTQNIAQIRFSNSGAYSMYRWYLTKIKGSANLMQIGEIELRGVVDTSGLPSFPTPPASIAAYDQTSATLSVIASGTPTPTLKWIKKNGANYTLITDGGTISGATTASLTINPVSFSNAGEYAAVAANNSGSVTSILATLTVVSTNTDVTEPSDPIIGFGDTTGTRYGESTNASLIIDNSTIAYINGGSGLNATAGFPPFGGPVGVVVTPAVGPTKLVGLRVYTSMDGTDRDPANYILEGSNNGGTSYTVLSQGVLNLPLARADNGASFDPIVQPMQEILFTTSSTYTSYRVTFNNTRNDNTSSSMSIGEIELLGGVSAPIPVISIAVTGGGNLSITTDIAGTLESKTNLTTGSWVSEGPISGTIIVTPNPAQPMKFYRVVVP